MKRNFLVAVLVLVLLLALSSCAGQKSSSTSNTVTEEANTTNSADSEATGSAEQTSTGETNSETEKERILELISPEKAQELLASDQEVLLLDVRTQAEYDEVHIPGSTLIPVEELNGRLEEISQWQNKPVIVYCRSGRRSAIAAKTLSDAGFSVIYDLGGINNWPYETE